MKNLTFSLVISGAIIGLFAANAQSQQLVQSTSGEAAKSNHGTPPVAGANSFTESQARERIVKAGFTGVKDLKQDERGVWVASAEKGGTPVKVALDFQGNIVQQ